MQALQVKLHIENKLLTFCDVKCFKHPMNKSILDLVRQKGQEYTGRERNILTSLPIRILTRFTQVVREYIVDNSTSDVLCNDVCQDFPRSIYRSYTSVPRPNRQNSEEFISGCMSHTCCLVELIISSETISYLKWVHNGSFPTHGI